MYVQPVVFPYDPEKSWRDYSSEARTFIREQYHELLEYANKKIVVFTTTMRYTDHQSVYIVDVSFDIQGEEHRNYYKRGV